MHKLKKKQVRALITMPIIWVLMHLIFRVITGGGAKIDYWACLAISEVLAYLACRSDAKEHMNDVEMEEGHEKVSA